MPYLVPEELECGVIGAAMLMAVVTGDVADIPEATARMVRFQGEVLPDPKWVETYDRMMPIYARLYESAKGFYADLDALTT